MDKSLRNSIIESRRLLRNPYAYLDGTGGYSALPNYHEASSEAISKSRLLQENPYAHENEFGGFSALSNSQYNKNSQKETRRSLVELEQLARSIQVRLWEERNQIWQGSPPSNPIAILDPFLAFKLLGYNCELEETLGQFRSGEKLIEVAGTIDKDSKLARVSRQFPRNVRNFTAAHELGHALMHKTSGLHRDRPLDGSKISRDAIEFEADKFATYFLIPGKTLQATFRRHFLTDKFTLTEATAFALGFGDIESLRNECKTLRQLSRLLASTERYNMVQFSSLASQFGVSIEAMAIRLEELDLLGM